MRCSVPAIAAVLCLTACAPRPGAVRDAVGATRPRLAVLIVVDQLRTDLLTRHDSLWTGGFRRLLDGGRLYVRASHGHAATVTAAGHASLSTGVHPDRHGIVGNAWWERSGDRWVRVENIFDPASPVVGHRELPGVSPRRLVRDGLADWIVAADARSQIASVSGKDRGAVQPAAHARGHVYWFEEGVGRFVTSTYYRERYPEWVDAFHATVLPRYAADTVWWSEIPAAARRAAGADTAAWEGDGIHTAFPHRFATEGREWTYWEWFAGSPALDALTLDFAESMVATLALGGDDAPDFLNVSLSQTDRIGHTYGPNSVEQLDNLLRLDRQLGEFLAFLDSAVGRETYVVALSADHGVLDAPEELRARGAYGHRATERERATFAALDTAAAARIAAGDRRAARWLADTLERLDVVAEAWTHEELRRGAAADSFAVLFRRSLYPGRAGGRFSRRGVEVRFVEGFLDDDLGTGHGAPYWHDRSVPVLFLGPGIAPGRDTAANVLTVDVAPTLARLLGIRAPRDLDGRVLGGGAAP